MISATMPISDMKNPNSCIPEFAILPSRKERNLFQIFPVLSSGKIYELCWRWGGEWAQLLPVMLLASGDPLSGTDMWDAGDVTRGGCVIITTAHACRCGDRGVGAGGTGLLRSSAKQQAAGHSALFPNLNKAAAGNVQSWTERGTPQIREHTFAISRGAE